MDTQKKSPIPVEKKAEPAPRSKGDTPDFVRGTIEPTVKKEDSK